MRAFAPALLIAYLLFGVPHLATAANKIKIEIVETTMTIGMVPHTGPGTPEHISTHCNRMGTDCDSTVIPATDPSSSSVPEILSFEAKAIFPDGSHVKLMCFPSRWNKKCGGIIPIAGSALDSAKCFAMLWLLTLLLSALQRVARKNTSDSIRRNSTKTSIS
jgi:hypothetical protein